MNQTVRKALIAAAVLGAFSVVGTGLVSLTYRQTGERIAENERQALLRNLRALIPPERYDNDVVADAIAVDAPELKAGGPVTVYRARQGGRPVAAIFTVVAPDGYSGDIKLLVGIYEDGTLAGVRVVSHKETPGLGDAVEESRSSWVLGFQGKSLDNPGEKAWAVKRDGGAFDQFTGATITPRAVVGAVRRTLIYFRGKKAKLFAGESLKEASK